jgi:hypothetical protein
MGNISFRPVRGLEAAIMTMGYNEGFVYFATDTKKIYVDANGQEKIPMGGNSGIYYGRMVLEETPDSGQKEFTFSAFDIEGNDDPTSLTIPNIDDLILNIPDGCFYRVSSIDETDEGIFILTEKLTIAGSGGGGGGGGGGGSVGSVTMDRLTPQAATILYEQEYKVGFNLNAVDSSGEQTGNGLYDVYVNGVKKLSNLVANQGENYIDVSPYLILGKNNVKISASMDIGGASNVTVSKTWVLTTTELKVIWDYDETTVNSTTENFVIEWTATGIGLSKTTHIIIDGNYHIQTQATSQTTSQKHIIEVSKMAEYNLNHGSHSFEMYVTAIGSDGQALPPTKSVFKYVMFAQPGNNTPIINVGIPTEKLTQYNTVQIPITIYATNNIAGTAVVTLKENSVIKDTWTNVKNQETKYWAYTPTTSGMLPLAVQCGQVEKTFTIDIEKVDIDISEVAGYAFKFKANEFASNSAIENWTDGSASVSFSDKFDWINGGLNSERDEAGGTRQFVRIKAGSQMTINYPLMETNATARGKTLKVVFKATNCRDYDA